MLAEFLAEVSSGRAPATKDLRSMTMDEAIERFLSEHLRDEKGREERTISDYRKLHRKWFSPALGTRQVSRVDTEAIDWLFGEMRAAGLSRSRLNQAKSLYQPFFRWARRRGIVTRDPMVGFELPTSRFISKERTPPEVEELCLLLTESVAVVPDVAPLLALGAVTGMRRGELVGVRRSRIVWDENTIVVDAAISGVGRVKSTKTRVRRSFHVDTDTMEMLRLHCQQMDEVAAAAAVPTDPDPYLFSLALDFSSPMPPDYVTKRVATLKEHLGIEDKKRETIEREDEALRLFRQPAPTRAAGKTGPTPTGGMSYRTIGQRLGRSERWAAMAVQAAERREKTRDRGFGKLDFDGSILALRKFTSSELLDAGFNISMVAHRQGHGPQVLAKHYAKSRRSADRKAAEHLGGVIHRQSVRR